MSIHTSCLRCHAMARILFCKPFDGVRFRHKLLCCYLCLLPHALLCRDDFLNCCFSHRLMQSLLPNFRRQHKANLATLLLSGKTLSQGSCNVKIEVRPDVHRQDSAPSSWPQAARGSFPLQFPRCLLCSFDGRCVLSEIQLQAGQQSLLPVNAAAGGVHGKKVSKVGLKDFSWALRQQIGMAETRDATLVM